MFDIDPLCQPLMRNFSKKTYRYPDLRALRIDKLLESLNVPLQEEINVLWAEEEERRLKEIQIGKVKSNPGEGVFKDIRKRLKK